jgi:hypothetical protein
MDAGDKPKPERTVPNHTLGLTPGLSAPQVWERVRAAFDGVEIGRPLDRGGLVRALTGIADAIDELCGETVFDENGAAEVEVSHPVASLLRTLVAMLEDLNRGITDPLLRAEPVGGTRAEGHQVRDAALQAVLWYRILTEQAVPKQVALRRSAKLVTDMGYRGPKGGKITPKQIDDWARKGRPGQR